MPGIVPGIHANATMGVFASMLGSSPSMTEKCQTAIDA